MIVSALKAQVRDSAFKAHKALSFNRNLVACASTTDVDVGAFKTETCVDMQRMDWQIGVHLLNFD